MAARDLAMAAAGTTAEHQRLFADEAERYRRRMVRTLNLSLAFNSRAGDQYKADRQTWASVPEFAPPRPTLAWSLMHERFAAGALLVWIAALVLIASRMHLAPLHRP
jgi:ABC-2 type transport system permease protein